MKEVLSPIKLELAKYLATAMQANYPANSFDLEFFGSQISSPPNFELGDFTFPCFLISKEFKCPPPQVAKKISEFKELPELIAKVEPQGPYVNFFLNSQALAKFLLPTILDQSFFKLPLFSNTPKLMIEYSQPNTHKELHVGHMRNLCLGNALINILRFSGLSVISATFPGDMGTHVAKCLWYLKYKNQDPIPAKNKGAWLGQIYSKAYLYLEETRGTEQEETHREQLTQILKQIEKKEGEFYNLWVETREWSIDQLKDVYKWAHVEFDRWYFESEVDSDSLKYANELFNQGLLVKDKGAIGMDLSADQLGFCLLVKTDGNGLYATKDIELARRKLEEFAPDENIYIVDKRQALHFKQVFKVLQKIGLKNADKCFHMEYDFVELPDGAMSSRKGNIVPLQSLIDQMQEAIKTTHLKKYLENWSLEQIEKTAHTIAEGAIKYGMLRMDHQKKIVFEMDEWLKTDGESGPYLQYVHARIHSILEKFPLTKMHSKYDFSAPTEHKLLITLAKFPIILQQCSTQRKIAPLCSYLFDLSKLFNGFYVECPIGRAADLDTQNGRLTLAKATALVLEKGLGLLGISAPHKM